MRNWQTEAPKWISRIHAEHPDATPDELRRLLRSASADFHCGTSWGKRVWPKHCKAYLAKMAGRGAHQVVEDAVWPADIVFPFRGEGAGS